MPSELMSLEEPYLYIISIEQTAAIANHIINLVKNKGYTTNAGTVTSVTPGAGLAGDTVTGSGTIKAKLKSETASSLTAAARGNTADREYPVGIDADGNLSVNVPWSSSGATVTASNGILHIG